MKKLFLILYLTLILPSIYAARTYIPEDYPTIQAGIDAVPEGDTILISGGTYTGPGNVDLTFNGKNLVVMTRGGFQNVTIDCNGTPEDPHVAFIFDNNETSASKIIGLRIINAYRPGFSGACTFLHGSATLSDCIIENNQISGIIFTNWSTPGVVHNCEIRNNTGSGIGYTPSEITISSCQIINNSGSGIISGGNVTLQSSVVAYNNDYGLFNANASTQQVNINNCTFAFNNIALHYETELPKSNILATGDISNTIFAFNQTGIVSIMTTVDLACSDFYGNTVNDLEGVDPAILTMNGNFSADPLFCDTVTQFLHLTSGSPCLADGNSCLESVGALGWHECACCKGIRGNIDYDPNDTIDISDLVALVQYMFSGGPGPACEVEADIDDDGMWGIGDVVYLVNYMFVPGSPPPLPCPYII